MRVERGGAEGLSDEDANLLRGLRAEYLELFGLTGEEAEILLFRPFIAPPPTGRALRREVPEVLQLG